MTFSLQHHFYKSYPLITLFIANILTAAIGILERVNGPLSLVWLTNAISIGLLVRFYQNINWRHFLVCGLGMILPDIFAETPVSQFMMMTSVNIITIWLGWFFLKNFASRSEDGEWLCTLPSVPQWLLLCQPALIIAGLLGSGGLFLIYDRPFIHTAVFWYLNESLNFIVFLPVILTTPKLLKSSKEDLLNIFLHILPSALLLFVFIFIKDEVCFLIASILIIPTIIWLSLSGNLFLTTFGISMNGAFFFMWIIHSSHGHIHFAENIYLSVVRAIITVMALCALTIAVVISERDKLFSKLSLLANHDDLTGILNRRAFTHAAETVISSLNDDDACSMVLIDIDFFKKINDKWGHQTGDKVLIAFCQRLTQLIPANQLFGRIGGEEFALLLSEIPGMNHKELAEKIIKDIARNPLNIDDKPFPLTISAGMTKWAVGQRYETLFKHADEALYQAKNNGRNQWHKYQPLHNTLSPSTLVPSLT